MPIALAMTYLDMHGANGVRISDDDTEFIPEIIECDFGLNEEYFEEPTLLAQKSIEDFLRKPAFLAGSEELYEYMFPGDALALNDRSEEGIKSMMLCDKDAINMRGTGHSDISFTAPDAPDFGIEVPEAVVSPIGLSAAAVSKALNQGAKMAYKFFETESAKQTINIANFSKYHVEIDRANPEDEHEKGVYDKDRSQRPILDTINEDDGENFHYNGAGWVIPSY